MKNHKYKQSVFTYSIPHLYRILPALNVQFSFVHQAFISDFNFNTRLDIFAIAHIQAHIIIIINREIENIIINIIFLISKEFMVFVCFSPYAV